MQKVLVWLFQKSKMKWTYDELTIMADFTPKVWPDGPRIQVFDLFETNNKKRVSGYLTILSGVWTLFPYLKLILIAYKSNPAATSSATASVLMAAIRARPKFMTSPGPLPVITLSETSTASPVTLAPISFGSKPG